MTVYKIEINIQLLLDDRSGYKPDLELITEDIFQGITGKGIYGENTIKRDVKIIDYTIGSEKE